MAEEVADRHFMRHPGIVHLKARVVVDHAVVPTHDAVAHQGRHGRRGQRLGHRGQLENRIGVDQFRAAGGTHAKPLEVDDLILVDHDNRQPRHFAGVNGRLRELLQLADGAFHLGCA